MIFLLIILPNSLGTSLLTAVLSAICACLVTFAGQHLLVTLPLKRLRHRELEPLAVARSIPYPPFGLAVIQYILSAFDDFRLQREAFGRLSDAYRALAQLQQASLTIKAALAVPFNAGLAQNVAAMNLDLVSKEAQPLAAGHTILQEEIQGISQEIEGDELECLQNGILWIATPIALSSSHYLLLRVEPRKLWAKTPKMYRRFFATLATLIIHHILSKESGDEGTEVNPNGAQGVSKPAEPLADHQTKNALPTPTLNHQGSLFGELPTPAQGLSRKSIFVDSAAADEQEWAPRWLGLSQRLGVRHSTDFLCLFYSTRSQRSLIFLGSVPQHTPDAATCARAAQAMLAGGLADRDLSADPEQTLQIATRAIEQTAALVFRMFRGQIAMGLACLAFDHQSGKGSVACFGHPSPYLVSPDERKPLLVSARALEDGLIGLAKHVKVRFTEFTVMPGQFVVACTIGMLALRDSERKSFEKEILRGRLSVIDPAVLRSSAAAIAEAVMDEAERHNSSSILTDDLTLLCLTPMETFPH